MSNDVYTDETLHQEECIFPNLFSNSFYESEMRRLKKEKLPYTVLIFVFLVSAVLFYVLFLFSLFGSTNTTINFGVLWGISVFAIIIDFILLVEKQKKINEVNFMIQVNNQYTEFITQGYTQKESYKLTVEWIDRQSTINAINGAANAANRMAAISMMHKINNN